MSTDGGISVRGIINQSMILALGIWSVMAVEYHFTKILALTFALWLSFDNYSKERWLG